MPKPIDNQPQDDQPVNLSREDLKVPAVADYTVRFSDGRELTQPMLKRLDEAVRQHLSAFVEMEKIGDEWSYRTGSNGTTAKVALNNQSKIRENLLMRVLERESFVATER